MLKEFKAFLLQGNVVELAVAVVIGAAFGAVVTAVVDGVITPLLGIFGDQDFSQYGWTIKDGIRIAWGAVLTALIKFVSVAAAIFFLVIKPINAITARRKRGEVTEDEPTPEDIALLQEIRDLLRQQAS